MVVYRTFISIFKSSFSHILDYEKLDQVAHKTNFLTRKRKIDVQGHLITEKEDLFTANEIMFESIILKIDELDGSLRQFYEQLKLYIQSKGMYFSRLNDSSIV